jgi:hypothetical protein
MNNLSALKFMRSHFAFYEWKVGFSLISPIIFSLGMTLWQQVNQQKTLIERTANIHGITFGIL